MQQPVVLLLAAGIGTRLRPLTHCLPKCLVPIHHHPLLFYWLEQLSHLGIKDCYINLHYKGKLVREVVESSRYRNWIHYVEEEALLGTAGTVRALYPHIKGRPLWLIHADNLSVANWSDFLTTYDVCCRPGDLLMQTFVTDDPRSCGVVRLDAQHRVQAFYEKVNCPPTNLANGAVYVLSPEVVSWIANTSSIQDMSTQVLTELMGKIVAWPTDGYHRDIGRWSAFKKAQETFSVPWIPASSQAWSHLWQDAEFISNWECAVQSAAIAEHEQQLIQEGSLHA